jgi:ABC-2 type transport system ATP-binding protein
MAAVMSAKFARWLAAEEFPMPNIVSVRGLRKQYSDGSEALKGIDLAIREGEILALLGPNGAGKTTLISAVCGIVRPTSGRIEVGGHDVVTDYRGSRSLIGLVPQEITIEPFERVMNSVRFTRGLFGKAADDAYLERLLKQLSLWDRRDSKIIELSGGMKRRVLIAKALSHEPRVLVLDEPTAGVDVELRRDMWEIVRRLQADGVTIILTTHYIEEAEAIADRIGVIARGELLLVEEKASLIRRLGRKEMRIELARPLETIPKELASYNLEREDDGGTLVYCYDTRAERTGIARLLAALSEQGLILRDVQTKQSSLEEIFVGLVKEDA